MDMFSAMEHSIASHFPYQEEDEDPGLLHPDRPCYGAAWGDKAASIIQAAIEITALDQITILQSDRFLQWVGLITESDEIVSGSG